MVPEGHPEEGVQEGAGYWRWGWGGPEPSHRRKQEPCECCHDQEKVQSLGKKTLPGTEEDQMVPGDQAHKPWEASVEFHTHCSAQRVLSVGSGDKGADDSSKKLSDEGLPWWHSG